MITESKDVTGRAGCTVRALANVTGISLGLVNRIATAAGRRKGRKFSSHILIEHAKSLGLRFRKVRMKTRTLARFLREHPRGRYYARKAGHAFAVVDGGTDSGLPSGTRITGAWQYLGYSGIMS